jgi:cytochrome c biogenesis protein CcdA
MPSLHFGYALLVGLTVMTIPLAPEHRRSKSVHFPLFNNSHPELAPQIRLPSYRRVACFAIGFMYPFSILVAIVSTANHFILDAVAGAIVCCIGWNANAALLNLLPLEDWFLWALRIHKPVQTPVEDGRGLGLKEKLEGWNPERLVVVNA